MNINGTRMTTCVNGFFRAYFHSYPTVVESGYIQPMGHYNVIWIGRSRCCDRMAQVCFGHGGCRLRMDEVLPVYIHEQ